MNERNRGKKSWSKWFLQYLYPPIVAIITSALSAYIIFRVINPPSLPNIESTVQWWHLCTSAKQRRGVPISLIRYCSTPSRVWQRSSGWEGQRQIRRKRMNTDPQNRRENRRDLMVKTGDFPWCGVTFAPYHQQIKKGYKYVKFLVTFKVSIGGGNRIWTGE